MCSYCVGNVCPSARVPLSLPRACARALSLITSKERARAMDMNVCVSLSLSLSPTPLSRMTSNERWIWMYASPPQPRSLSLPQKSEHMQWIWICAHFSACAWRKQNEKSVSKETKYSVKRDLVQCQKRPSTVDTHFRILRMCAWGDSSTCRDIPESQCPST